VCLVASGLSRLRHGRSGTTRKRVAKKKSIEEVRKDIRDLAKPDANAPVKPPFDWKKTIIRVGGLFLVLWIVCGAIGSFLHSQIPLIVAAVLTTIVAGILVWIARLVKKQQAIGNILQGAETEEGRKEAIEKLSSQFKKGDAHAVLAKAQLEMQDDPKKALATLEAVDLSKQVAPIAAQIRAMRAMLHLTMGDVPEARKLVDQLDLGKQQEAKTRAMFATVAGEAWARSGQAQKAIDALELFNPEDPENAELKVQMWRARAFAYASLSDLKGVGRTLRKLADMNPQLLAMFVGQKKIHPLLEKEAKQLVMKLGVAPRQVVRQRM